MYLNRMYCAEENPQKGFHIKWILSLRYIIRQQTNRKLENTHLKWAQYKRSNKLDVKTGRRGEVRFKKRGKKPSFILIQYIVAHKSAAFVDEETSSSSILHPCMLQSSTHPPTSSYSPRTSKYPPWTRLDRWGILFIHEGCILFIGLLTVDKDKRRFSWM